MKPIIPFALLGALFAVGAATAATTTPVGYETLTLAPGQYNLVGVRLFSSPVAAGEFDSSTATTLVDNEATFSLTAGTSYIIELENGATITTDGADFSGTTISNLTGITPAFEDSYIVREATTVAKIFGEANEAGLAFSANADPTEADLIYVPKVGGGFTRVFYSTYADEPGFFGWLDADEFTDASDVVMHPSEAIYVETRISASPINLTVSGEVKLTPTSFVAESEFTLMSSVYPAGATLATSGLSAYLQSSANADPTEADLILIPKSAGGFTRAFFSTYTDEPGFDGWLDADEFNQIPDEEFSSGFYIQKVGPSINGSITPPSFYSSL